jgi:hypothetical protein
MCDVLPPISNNFKIKYIIIEIFLSDSLFFVLSINYLKYKIIFYFPNIIQNNKLFNILNLFCVILSCIVLSSIYILHLLSWYTQITQFNYIYKNNSPSSFILSLNKYWLERLSANIFAFLFIYFKVVLLLLLL